MGWSSFQDHRPVTVNTYDLTLPVLQVFSETSGILAIYSPQNFIFFFTNNVSWLFKKLTQGFVDYKEVDMLEKSL